MGPPISFQSGGPVSVSAPVDIARIGASSSRASVTGAPNLPGGERTLAHWFKAEAFLNPNLMTPGQFGNSGRNILIGPGPGRLFRSRTLSMEPF